VFAINDLLYVIGGNRGSICSLEIYHPDTNSWELETLPKNFGKMICGVVVDRLSQFRIN